MITVKRIGVPEGSFLKAYEGREGCETDCFQADVPGHPDIDRFVHIFFDTWVFRIERRLLALLGEDYATSEDVAALAGRSSDTLAAWTVQDRSADEIILAFKRPRGRTWLQATQLDGSLGSTRLRFGSALLPNIDSEGQTASISWGLKIGLPLHRLYARLLLAAAARDWKKGRQQERPSASPQL